MGRRAAGVILFLCLAVAAEAESASLAQGQESYRQGDYLAALADFQKILADPEGRKLASPYLWIAKVYYILLDTKNAASNLDYYLQNFPQDPERSDGLYLEARIFFSEGDYRRSIEAFGSYLDQAPSGENVPNALYWMGESAFSLGHYQEAATLFTKVVQGYPTSFKVEAARYRLSLIDLQKREDELLKLLQWSHTEALNASEDFRRREQSYAQELASYQKEILALKSSDIGSQLAALEEEVKSRDAIIAALKSTPTTAASTDSKTVTLLRLQVQALTLKAQLLERKVAHDQ